jgi:hypothetical protein
MCHSSNPYDYSEELEMTGQTLSLYIACTATKYNRIRFSFVQFRLNVEEKFGSSTVPTIPRMCGNTYASFTI